ncbi:MAG TPA: hypothetical protein DDY20_05500 [Desulfobulbaceae bacterium]|nr:hypothetical protein [Desulfobulbaceae bacterium]
MRDSMTLRWQYACLLFLLVSSLSLRPAFAQDAYEKDNTYLDAGVIVINDLTFQKHDLHTADDQDWIMFFALESTNYQVEITNAGSGIDPFIELYDTDGTSLLVSPIDVNGPGGDETLLWHCPQGKEGIYFARIGHVASSPYGSETGYRLELIIPGLFSLPEYLTGTIRNGSALPVAMARISVITDTGAKGSGISLPNGSFILCLEPGNYSVTVQANGYDAKTVSASAPGNVNVILNTWPVARDDNFETTRGGTVSGNVLANDFDGDGNSLTAVLNSNVRHGVLNLGRDGSFSYTHDGGNDTVDSFTYHASDGRAGSAPATVTIFLEKINLPFLMLLLNGSL